jgi:hypothetical protein
MRAASIAYALSIAVTVLSAGRLQAQAPARGTAAIAELAADAGALPPEFAADALIRIAGSGRIASAARVREMLEDAFMRAYGAHDEYRLGAHPLPLDSRQGSDLLASEAALTRISLQTRAVRLLAAIDPERARELFGWIDLNVESGSCATPFAPAVDEYYATLSILARRAFPPERRDAVLNFLQLYLWRAHLPSEMPAVAAAIRDFHPVREDAALLEITYGAILNNASSDPRGFSYAGLEIFQKTTELEDAHRRLDLTGWYLTRSLRKYLIAQLSGPQCSDSPANALLRDTFNASIRRRDAIDDGIAEISASDARPSRLLIGATIESYWKTPQAARLYSTFMQLRGPSNAPVSESTRRLPVWRDRADHFVFDLNQWSRGREPERDFFGQKALLFSQILDLMPKSDVRVKARQLYVEFLRRADPAREQRSLWFAFVKRLIEEAREERAEVLASLENSHHQVLTLYARLERIAPLSRSFATEKTDR